MKLKTTRIDRGISVPQLAELSGVPRRTIQDIEKRGDCLISTARKLAKALGVDMNELCSDDILRRVSIIDTGEIKELPYVVEKSETLVQKLAKRVVNPCYEFEMSQEDYDWWCDVQDGINMAREKGLDNTDMSYDDYFFLKHSTRK